MIAELFTASGGCYKLLSTYPGSIAFFLKTPNKEQTATS